MHSPACSVFAGGHCAWKPVQMPFVLTALWTPPHRTPHVCGTNSKVLASTGLLIFYLSGHMSDWGCGYFLSLVALSAHSWIISSASSGFIERQPGNTFNCIGLLSSSFIALNLLIFPRVLFYTIVWGQYDFFFFAFIINVGNVCVAFEIFVETLKKKFQVLWQIESWIESNYLNSSLL